MSKCDIRIEVARVNYKMGDTVKGVVYVDVDKECRCDGLVIGKFWATHGRGNRNSGGGENLELFKGVWNAGLYSYPFEFTLEDGPLTYRGNYINIDWYLKARADIPWAFDPSDSKEFIIERGERKVIDEPQVSLSESGPAEIKSKAKLSPYIMIIFPMLFAVLGLYFLFVQYDLIFGIVFTSAGTVISYRMIQSTLAEKKLGEVKYELDKDTLSPGDNISCLVSFTTRENVHINAIDVTLSGREVVVSGSGTNESTYTYHFHVDTIPVPKTGKIVKGTLVHENVVFELPEDAAASFNSSSNDIIWQVGISIDIPKWPDWSETLALTVVA